MTNDFRYSSPERSPDERHHDLIASLATISAQMQLTQRRLLRADGLSTLERDMMLGSLADAVAEIKRLTAQLERPRMDGAAFGGDGSADGDPST